LQDITFWNGQNITVEDKRSTSTALVYDVINRSVKNLNQHLLIRKNKHSCDCKIKNCCRKSYVSIQTSFAYWLRNFLKAREATRDDYCLF